MFHFTSISVAGTQILGEIKSNSQPLPTPLQTQCFRCSPFFLFKTKNSIMDHSLHLVNAVQYNLLRHLHVIYSAVIAQNNVWSLDGNEIWIVTVNSLPQKCVPVPVSSHHNFRISNSSHCSVNMRNSISDNFQVCSHTQNTSMLEITTQGNRKGVQHSDSSVSLLYFAVRKFTAQRASQSFQNSTQPFCKLLGHVRDEYCKVTRVKPWLLTMLKDAQLLDSRNLHTIQTSPRSADGSISFWVRTSNAKGPKGMPTSAART